MIWNNKFKEKLDLETNEVIFKFQKQRYSIIASQQKRFPVISLNTVSASYQKGLPLFLISLKAWDKENDRERSEESKSFFLKYEDIFREILPKELPSKRRVRFRIELHEDTILQKKDFYQIFRKELKELGKPQKELFEQDFIRFSTSFWDAPVLSATKKNNVQRHYIVNQNWQ